jgi:hypothetical protein
MIDGEGPGEPRRDRFPQDPPGPGKKKSCNGSPNTQANESDPLRLSTRAALIYPTAHE